MATTSPQGGTEPSATAIYAPAHQQVMSKLETSAFVAILPLSLYVYGLTTGPMKPERDIRAQDSLPHLQADIQSFHA